MNHATKNTTYQEAVTGGTSAPEARTSTDVAASDSADPRRRDTLDADHGSGSSDHRAIATPSVGLTVDDMDNLRHMLGVSERTPRGYRNYFVAGAADVASMERLRAHGFVVKNERYGLSDDHCYHATNDGARCVGLKALPR